MKRGILLVFLVIFFMSVSFIAAQNETTEDLKVDKAYSCLQNKIDDRTCSELSVEEEIFSLLATGKCRDELLSDSSNNECWPKGNCNVKTTAQAILALKNIGSSTSLAESWLLSKNRTTENINWYLQIESSEATTCTISYSGSSYQVAIGDDKKISSNAGTCLTLAQNNYWLRVSPICYNREFSISCDKSFLTSLLYQEQGSDTFYVSESTNSASAGGTVTEKINSFCFSSGDSCNYEGSLWAALALDSAEHDVSPYIPYLITMSDKPENNKYLPEAFLYILTGELRTGLLAKQKNVNNDYYWEESGDKFYDTALALYPFQYENPQEKINSKEWLLKEGVQETDGCWDGGNIRNTAFILHSIWPKESLVAGEAVDCEEAGYNCMSSISCNNLEGEILEGYSCSGALVCCDRERILETCAEQEGEICSSGETCRGGTTVDASDLGIGESCCLVGSCEEVQEISDCELSGGVCRLYQCDENEEESFEDCEISSEVCCVKETRVQRSYVGIIVFGVLIVLVILGIVFREKLRPLWLKLKSKFGKGKGKPGPGVGPGMPPRFPPPGMGRIPPGRPIPGRPGFPGPRRMPVRRPPARPAGGELSDVLKKLKEMGK